MKKSITVIIICLIVLTALTFCGCSQKYWIGKCYQKGICKTVKDSTHIIIKDSTYLVPIPYTTNPDTAWVTAWLECDSSREVIMKQSETVNGKYIRLVKDIEGGKYTVYAYLPARVDTVLVKQTDHSQSEYKIIVQHTETNILKPWQKWFIGIGIGLSVLVLIYIGYRIYKKIKV